MGRAWHFKAKVGGFDPHLGRHLFKDLTMSETVIVTQHF